MEYSRWPFPAHWGKPADIPREALQDEEAAREFIAGWAKRKIEADRRAGRRPLPRTLPAPVAPGYGITLTGHQARAQLDRRRPLSGLEARAALRDRQATEARHRQLALLRKAAGP